MTIDTSPGVRKKRLSSCARNSSIRSSSATASSASRASWRTVNDADGVSTQDRPSSVCALDQQRDCVRRDRLDLGGGALELVIREDRRPLERELAVQLDPRA